MRAITFVLMAGLFGLGGCQSSPQTYPALIERLAEGKSVSVAKIHTAFLEHPDFPKRLERLTDLEAQAMQLLDDEPLKLGSIGTAILDEYYASLTGHLVMERFYQHVESEDEAVKHTQWKARIVAHMRDAGDGSESAPYLAMTTVEPHAFAKELGQSAVGSIYRNSDASPFALLLQTKGSDGPIEHRYFDLTAVYEAIKSLSYSANDPQPYSAFNAISYLARDGDTAAQAAIGTYLVSHSRWDDAIDWLRASSRSGNLLANSILARVYWERANDAESAEEKAAALEQTLENYLHAIALGSPDAMYSLGVLYFTNEYGEDNHAAGLPLLQKAASAKHAGAALYLAHLHYQGSNEVEQDFAKAGEYFINAANTGSARAKRDYARYLMDRRSGAQAHESTLQWLESLAEQEDAEAMLLLGNLHARGIGTRSSPRRAVRWYEQAVDVAPTNANIVNEVAWTLTVTDISGLKRARYALTIMDTMMNSDDSARQRPEYLDTWAIAHAANGKFDRAVALQDEALVAAKAGDDPSVLDILKEHLDALKQQQTITEPAP